MNKRQAKKVRKKVVYPLVDEMNLLTLSPEEYRVAMEDFHKWIQKNCSYKHYKDRDKKAFGFGCYRFPVGAKYREQIVAVLKRARRFNDKPEINYGN